MRQKLGIGLLVIGLVMCAAASRGQTIAYAIPVKGPTIVVAPQRLGELRDVPYLGTLRVDLLPGFSVKGAPAIGLALSKPFALGKDLDLWLGAHTIISQGVPASAGLYVGFGWRLQ